VPRLPATIVVLGACLTLVTGGASEPPPGGPGPGPPPAVDLPDVRWHTFPADVRRVLIGPDGRAWFTRKVAEVPDRPAFRRRVEEACAEQVPWISGGDLILLDRRGRVWCRSDAEPGKLLGYDPAAARWQERAVEGQIGPTDDWMRHPVAHESAAGRLFFVAGHTAHVLDGDTWTAESLVRLNDEHGLHAGGQRAFNPFQFVEDARGNVYAWSGWERYGWSGSVGCLVHDGRGWGRLLLHEWGDEDRALVKRIRGGEKLGNELGKRYGLRGVLPLTDQVVLLPWAGDAKAFPLPGAEAAAGKPDLPPATAARFAGMWPLLRGRGGDWWIGANRRPLDPWAKEPELVILAADGAVNAAPAAAREFALPTTALAAADGHVYFGTYGRGCAAVEGDKPEAITALGEEDIVEILAEDRDGRIFLRGGDRIHCWNPRWPEVRRGLSAALFRVPRGENEACLDSAGRVWARVAQPDGMAPLLSINDGAWQASPPADADGPGIVLLQPLRDGGLVAQYRPGGRAFFHDGKAWHGHESLSSLVEDRHAELVRRIDNRRIGRDGYARLRVDAAGRIWIVEWTTIRVHDGMTCTDLTQLVARPNVRLHFCWPLPGTTGVLLGGDGVALAVDHKDGEWRVENLRLPARIVSDYTTRSGLWLDSQGRLWLPNDERSAAVVEGRETRAVQDVGFPRFEDAAGRIWFASSDGFVILDKAGRRGRVAAWAAAAIAEDRPGSVWLVGRDGVVHLSVADGDAGPRVDTVARYTKGVPCSPMLEAFIDARHRLWCYGPGPTDYRLWRLELPEPAEPSE